MPPASDFHQGLVHAAGISTWLPMQPPSPEGFEMDLFNLEVIARAAEKACVAVIDRPNDPQVREQLFDALAAVVDPTFGDNDDTASTHLDGLLRQAHVLAIIVRTRIDGFQTTKRSDASARSIRYPTRDLLQILSELVAEFAGSA